MPALILLADDDHDTVEAYTALFRARGYLTEAAHDGPAALARALALQPALMVLDIGLPRMSGLEVLRHLRADVRGARLPVLVLSGYAYPRDVDMAKQHGCNAVLTKPCEPEELCRTAERVMKAAIPAARSPQPRDPGASQMRPPKPRRASRPATHVPPTLESQLLRADFLCRHSEELRLAAATASARALDIRSRCRAAQRGLVASGQSMSV
jgi:CheY-like chemotaxis protein